jgi:hypothetical protein
VSAPAETSGASPAASSTPSSSASDTSVGAGRAFLAVCGALIGWSLGYALPTYARLSRAFYDPIARHWFWGRSTAPIPMGYAGQLLWALGCALVSGALGWLLGRKTPSARAYALGSAWALTALVIIAAYFTWNNWPG